MGPRWRAWCHPHTVASSGRVCCSHPLPELHYLCPLELCRHRSELELPCCCCRGRSKASARPDPLRSEADWSSTFSLPRVMASGELGGDNYRRLYGGPFFSRQWPQQLFAVRRHLPCLPRTAPWGSIGGMNWMEVGLGQRIWTATESSPTQFGAGARRTST
jgi:hypothetical protein